jgi:hypothetical protein
MWYASSRRPGWSRIGRLLERMGLTGLNPNGYVNRQSLQEMHDFFVRKGTITQPVPLDALVDDSFVTAALAQLAGWPVR